MKVAVAEAAAPTPTVGTCDHSRITPELIEQIRKSGYTYQGKWYSYANFITLDSAYKAHVVLEMSCYWKGTPMEKYTVPLIAMVIQECGSLSGTACTGMDSGKAWGITQHNICIREFDGKHFCTWSGKKSPMEQFKEYIGADAWASWKSQFFHYSDVVRGDIAGGMDADDVIRSWNSREAGRRAKVARWEPFVKMVIGQ